MADAPFASRLASHPRPVVVDVWAPWCAPCRWMVPIVERLQTEYEGRVDVWRVNADEEPEVLRALGIFSIPTLMAFREGKEITRKVGAGSEDDMRALFEAALVGERPPRRSIAPLDRILRLVAGTAIIVLALRWGPSVFLLVVGGTVLFTAVADRCPIWQAIRPRIAALFRHSKAASGG